MTEKEQTDQLVSMLDSFMENGGGHMNIVVENCPEKACQKQEDGTKEKHGNKEKHQQQTLDSLENSDELTVQMDVYPSLDCSKIPMACAVPTLHQGIDEKK